MVLGRFDVTLVVIWSGLSGFGFCIWMGVMGRVEVERARHSLAVSILEENNRRNPRISSAGHFVPAKADVLLAAARPFSIKDYNRQCTRRQS